MIEFLYRFGKVLFCDDYVSLLNYLRNKKLKKYKKCVVKIGNNGLDGFINDLKRTQNNTIIVCHVSKAVFSSDTNEYFDTIEKLKRIEERCLGRNVFLVLYSGSDLRKEQELKFKKITRTVIQITNDFSKEVKNNKKMNFD